MVRDGVICTEFDARQIWMMLKGKDERERLFIMIGGGKEMSESRE